MLTLRMPALYGRIYRLFFAFLGSFALAFIAPRFASGGSDGFAAGAIAAVAFLACAVAAAVFAIWLAVVTLRRRGELRRITLIVGLLPALIVATVAFRIWHDLHQPTTIVVPASAPTHAPTTAPR